MFNGDSQPIQTATQSVLDHLFTVYAWANQMLRLFAAPP